jgi:hypothetical protein
MRKRFRIGLTSLAIATVAIAGATVATAAIVGSRSSATVGKTVERVVLKAHQRDIAGLDEPANLQAPVAAPVFSASFGDQTGKGICLSPQKVLERLQADQKSMGGKTVMLADGLQQSFADVWRREAHVAPVRVSSVVAHLFSDDTGSEWNADVVEFDANGCAMSRTLVPGDIWNTLLKTAIGVQA